MRDGSAGWSIALDLLSSANRAAERSWCTAYTRTAICNSTLTAAFPTALADALDHSLAHSAQVIAVPGQNTSLIAAQAG